MTSSAASHWTLADLPLAQIELPVARADENAFYLVCSASFVESGADLYTQNLIDFFAGDSEVADWLRTQWEPEELQHGQALRAYMTQVWPEFDWQRAHAAFLEEYAQLCKVELLAPTRALELVARCVVETGTATFYGALSRSPLEPVLRDLTRRIAADEVRHYKHFYRFFRRYRDSERLGRTRVVHMLAQRTMAMKSEDADCAIRHALQQRDPQRAADRAHRQCIAATMNRTVRQHVRAAGTLKMLLRPLDLPPRLEPWVQYPVAQFMQKVFLR